MHMGETMKAPFSKYLKGALAMDIAIHDRSSGK
jgi:hypothetical protein